MARGFHIRQRLIGALLCLALGVLASGVLAPRIGPDSPLMPLARLADSPAPQVLVLAAVLAGLAMLLGARWSGGIVVLLSAGALAGLVAGHLGRSDPLVPGPAALRVVFFNAFSKDRGREERILAALRAADPDVVVLAESGDFTAVLPELRQSWPYLQGCNPECEVLIASRFPIRGGETRALGPLWPNRYAQVTLDTPGGAVNLTAVHLAKPWTIGVAHAETAMLARWLNIQDVPLVVVGDFNAAPWSAPLRQLAAWTGIRATRWPVATWPVAAGRFGVPIDNVFVRGGPRVVSLAPFGDGLGSNHRGLLAEIALP